VHGALRDWQRTLVLFHLDRSLRDELLWSALSAAAVVRPRAVPPLRIGGQRASYGRRPSGTRDSRSPSVSIGTRCSPRGTSPGEHSPKSASGAGGRLVWSLRGSSPQAFCRLRKGPRPGSEGLGSARPYDEGRVEVIDRGSTPAAPTDSCRIRPRVGRCGAAGVVPADERAGRQRRARRSADLSSGGASGRRTCVRSSGTIEAANLALLVTSGWSRVSLHGQSDSPK